MNDFFLLEDLRMDTLSGQPTESDLRQLDLSSVLVLDVRDWDSRIAVIFAV